MRTEPQTKDQKAFWKLRPRTPHAQSRLFRTLLIRMTAVAPLVLRDAGQIRELDRGVHASFPQKSESRSGVG